MSTASDSCQKHCASAHHGGQYTSFRSTWYSEGVLFVCRERYEITWSWGSRNKQNKVIEISCNSVMLSRWWTTDTATWVTSLYINCIWSTCILSQDTLTLKAISLGTHVHLLSSSRSAMQRMIKLYESNFTIGKKMWSLWVNHGLLFGIR